MVTIPMGVEPSYKIRIELSGEMFILRFDWNFRGNFWTMSVLLDDDTEVLSGVRLVIGYPLLKDIVADRTPKGLFYCLDTQVNTMGNEPGRLDFVQDRDLSLIYIGYDEL